MKQKLFLTFLVCLYALTPLTVQSDQNHHKNGSFFSQSTTEKLIQLGTALIIAVTIAYVQMKETQRYQAKGTSLWTTLQPGQITESFASVAGAHEAKEALSEIVNFLKNPEYYSRLGAKIPKGVLLTGNPGTGKTLLARAVAGEANCTFINVSGSAFVEMYVGVGAARVRAMFEEAAQYAPCIIFIDEFDALAAKRTQDSTGGCQEHNHTVNQLLTCMDGFLSKDAKHPIIVIGATNHESQLDPAVLRPGRFDRIIQVPLPSTTDRANILKIHLNNVTCSDDIDVMTLAQLTPGFSGADLQQVVNQAALIATKKGLNAVSTKELHEAIDLIMLGAPAKHIIQNERDKRVTAYHEAGHALMHLLLPEVSNKLHGVTIVPRNKALGLTYSLPQDDKYSSNKEEMLAQICVVLAGRAAEEFMFKEISTGAHNDFEKASAIAHAMICTYGMSDNLGKRIYTNQNVSEKILQQIDAEILKILDEQYERVMTLLKNNKHLLVQLAEALIKKETLYAPEIYKLLNISAKNTPIPNMATSSI